MNEPDGRFRDRRRDAHDSLRRIAWRWACRARALALVLPALTAVACTASARVVPEAFGNLGASINSRYDDYAPALADSATLIFTSNRFMAGEANLQRLERFVRPNRLFSSMSLGAGWDEAQPYPVLLDERDAESATITFAPAGSPFGIVAYVGACRRSDTIGGCDLYAVVQGSAAALVNLGRDVNSTSWDGQPFVTADGMRLYFASDRSGGFGGSDIWYCERLPSGSWGTPRNAGPAINTAADELSPFVDAATGRIYFAAKTPDAGFDIFMVEPAGTSRQRLTAPYNSEGNDLTPFISGSSIYLASDRTGGLGGYDVYGFAMAGE